MSLDDELPASFDTAPPMVTDTTRTNSLFVPTPSAATSRIRSNPQMATGENEGKPLFYPTYRLARATADSLQTPGTPQTLKAIEKSIMDLPEFDSECIPGPSNLGKRKSIENDRMDWTDYPMEEEGDLFGDNQLVEYSSDRESEISVERYDSTSVTKLQIINPPLQSDVIGSLHCRTLRRSYKACNSRPHRLSMFLCNLDNHYALCKTCKGKSNQWLLDSGASVHVTNSIDDFVSYQPMSKLQTIRTAAKNRALNIQGVGMVMINHELVIDGVKQQKNTRLTPVYYVPGLDTRLMSMGEMLKKGNLVSGDGQSIKVTTSTGYPLFDTHLHGNDSTLYWVNSALAETVTNTKHVLNHILEPVPTFDVWHKRFGHPSNAVLNKAPKHVIGMNPVNPDSSSKAPCQGCAKGKMTSKPYPISKSRASKPFDLVHSDLKEFPVHLYHWYKWYVLFIDAHTGHAWVCFLRHKSEAASRMAWFIAMVRNQFQTTIKTWHFDGGGEFLKGEPLLRKHGINIHKSLPHEQQQNGRAERFNRTIMDKAQSLRFTSGFPQSWWEFCVEMAVFLYNRTPMRCNLWITPYESLKHEKPNLKDLRILCCSAYVWLPPEVRVNSLNPKAEEMTFIGFTEGMKGWKFMQTGNRIFQGATAWFNESRFPKRQDNPPVPMIDQSPDRSDDMGNSDHPEGLFHSADTHSSETMVIRHHCHLCCGLIPHIQKET